MLEFTLLGPVEVRVDSRTVDTGTLKQRAVLAVLLLEFGRPVGTADLVDRVWGTDPPQAASSVIYGHLSRIRRLLGRLPGDQLTLDRRPDGYLLNVDPDRVDVHRARRLARSTAGGDREREAALRAAISLWSGEPLAGLTGSWFDQIRDELRQQHVDLLLRWSTVAHRLGYHENIIEAIRPILAEHPLVEPVAAAFMRALYASGRGAEALDRFAAMRDRLAEELGVDPGPELRDLHRDIVRGVPDRSPQADVPAEVTPAQLPLDAHGFTGRDAELTRLDAILSDVDGRAAVAVVALSGTAGVGKTTLALHWAHRVKDRFPAGQLYVNLRGYDTGGTAMRPSEALRGFLEALGVPPRRIPPALRDRGDLFRSMLAGKRILVLLDNARDAEHVRPLLPGSAGCLVVVTSRDTLTGLIVQDGAQPLPVGVLAVEQARRMFARRVGAARVLDEPDGAATIVSRCAGVPLALAITAARAVVRADLTLGDLARELTDGDRTLDALDVDDPGSSMRAVLSWSYRTLSPAAARIFRLFGLHPGPHVTIEALASLAGVSVEEVRVGVAELVDAHLLTQDGRRYVGHDLIREYAAELAPADEPDAVRRLLDHYLHGVSAAADLAQTGREPDDVPPPGPGVTVPVPAGREEALGWLVDQHHTLTAIVALAAAAGAHDHTWRLGLSLAGFLDNQGHWQDWVTTMGYAVDAAAALGDRAVRARAHRNLARAHAQVGAYAAAHTHYEQALRLLAALDDRAGQAATHFSMSWLADLQDDEAGSLHHTERSLELYEQAGHKVGQGRALNALGWEYAVRDEHARALTYCNRALVLQQESGDDDGQAATWDTIGYTRARLGRPDQAVPCFEKALRLYQQCGDRLNEADVLEHLGDAQHAAGHPHEARSAWHKAAAILQQLEHPRARQLAEKLSDPL